jgi:mRNA-degrading endonuclease RelE of RelBE toxin-antitoxin system
MRIYQSSSFAKKVKKLKRKQKQHLDNAVKNIISDPQIGVEKRGDLKEVFVYKFKIQGVL